MKRFICLVLLVCFCLPVFAGELDYVNLWAKNVNEEMRELRDQIERKAKIRRACIYSGYLLSTVFILNGLRIFFTPDATSEQMLVGEATVCLGVYWIIKIKHNW